MMDPKVVHWSSCFTKIWVELIITCPNKENKFFQRNIWNKKIESFPIFIIKISYIGQKNYITDAKIAGKFHKYGKS